MSNSYKIKPLPKGSKFPFIVMPVSSDECMPTGHPNSLIPEDDDSPRRNTCDRNGAAGNLSTNRRSSAAPRRDIQPRIPIRYTQGIMETLTAQEQLRRPAHLLYPSTSQTTIPATTPEETLPTELRSRSRPRQSVYGYGVAGPTPREREHQLEMYACAAELLRRPSAAVSVPPPRAASNSNFRRAKSKVPSTELISDNGDRNELRRNSNRVQICEEAQVVSSSGTPQAADRNSSLQNQMELLFAKLRDKEGEILSLRNEFAAMQESVKRTNSESEASKAQCSSLRHELARVEQQLESLEERFDNQDDSQSINLASNISAFAGIESIKLARPVSASEMAQAPDFDGIIRNIRELNILVGNNQSMELCYNSGGATFKQSEAVIITLFKNGYISSDSPKIFRAFSSAAAIQFFQDIYDGYFPAELQCKYPDGITLVVKDKRTTLYPEDGCFAGKGRRLGDEVDVELLPKFYPGMKYPVLKPIPAREARSAESANSESTDQSDISLTAYTILPQLLLARPTSSSQRPLYKSGMNRVITLKLKNLVTGALYKVGASISSTPDDLVQHLQKFVVDDSIENDVIAPGNFQKFELINSIPFGIFTIGGATLREYGITSNTLIYFRPS